MFYELKRVNVDPSIAQEVIKLYKELDRGNGGEQGTWHSSKAKTNPYSWFDNTFTEVKNALGKLTIDEWWFNCGELGDEYRWHKHVTHPKAAVLYLQTPPGSGAIEFREYEGYHTFHPTPGDFIIFSGNLAHRVLQSNSLDYRVSVAFNLR